MVATPWIKRAVSYKYVTLYILFVALFCFLLRNSRFAAKKGVVIVCSGANSGCILLVVHARSAPGPDSRVSRVASLYFNETQS